MIKSLSYSGTNAIADGYLRFVQSGTSTRVQVDANAAADAARLAEWEFHNAVLAMKEVVRGQYGADSDQAQAVGLKKKSEYKRPSRKKLVAS
ncbi:MAG: hypothetical protein V7K62_05150 [Nostoc sp.]